MVHRNLNVYIFMGKGMGLGFFAKIVRNIKQRNLRDEKIIRKVNDLYLAAITHLVRILVYPPLLPI